MLTQSTDSNLYILSDLSDGIGVLSLNFMSVFLHHIMSVFSVTVSFGWSFLLVDVISLVHDYSALPGYTLHNTNISNKNGI